MAAKPQFASNPASSAAVIASAGSGKTWTLVSRLLRLLLQDTDPGNILAITFTVRAAAEMKQRLLERLEQWSICTEEELRKYLEEIDHPINQQTLRKARRLFEEQLHATTGVRTLTFHAFFQEILTQLPIEAGVPTGFELTENTFDHEKIALEQLLEAAHADKNSLLAKNLLVLLEHLGYNGTKSALQAFLKQRSDWWAWTEGIDNSEKRSSFASDALALRQDVDFDTDHVEELFNEVFIKKLVDYAGFYLADVFSATINTRANDTQGIVNDHEQSNARISYERLVKVLLKSSDKQPFKESRNAKAIKQFGEDRLDQAHKSYEEICQKLNDVAEQLKRQENHHINSAWYVVGEHYLNHFQQQKRQRRQLDFSDLEWKAYQLLSNADDFSLVRSKLDDTVEHLLIDEFQDTNPTQWRFVLPLLKDFSDSVARRNNIFIVGDSKQSIYGFRRANPALLGEAAEWVEEEVGGQIFRENASYRSSPIIMDTVNRIFSKDGYLEAISTFEKHTSHKSDLWGRVEIWPEFQLPQEKKSDKEVIEFRNPLLKPRQEEKTAYHLEAEAIAKRIEELVNSGLEIECENKTPRPAQYNDIQILVRKRTHVGKIEQQLQARNIPFRGSTRGSFMERIEIKDLCALLRTIVTPADNLSLAHVLRSPIFSASNKDLTQLSEASGEHWFERLLATTKLEKTSVNLVRAERLLKQWQKLALRLPLHDLVTTIFHQGNIVNRYLAAFPAWQSAQLNANLHRFVELALDVNSGRYPGIHHFLQHLQLQAQASGDESISEPVPNASGDCVDILTIHQAKGLEAPVVIVANCNQGVENNSSGKAIVDWPSGAEKPKLIALLPRNQQRDAAMRELHEIQQRREHHEAANLLYVALTRAKQLLIVSASQSKKGSSIKIPDIKKIRAIFPETDRRKDGRIVLEKTPPTYASKSDLPVGRKPKTKLSPKLKEQSRLPKIDVEIAPSKHDQESNNQGSIDGRLRGTVVHQFLQALIVHPGLGDQPLLSQVAASNSLEITDARLTEWLKEAQCTIKAFPDLLSDKPQAQCYTELPVVFESNNNRVFGIIDRVIVENGHITVIDFKTHKTSESKQKELAQSFTSQMQHYQTAVSKLWPGRKTKTGILFTENNQLVWLDVP